MERIQNKKNKELFSCFNSKEYLKEYYQDLSQENISLLDWYIEIYEDLSGERLLEIGGGPTVYQLISAAPKVDKIVFTDFAIDNIRAIKKWRNASNNFWDDFVAYVIEKEGVRPSNEDIFTRSNLIRKKIEKIEILDISTLKRDEIGGYDILQANFCIDSSTNNINMYEKMLKNIFSYLKKGGQLNMAALEKANSYKVGKMYYPALYLTKNSLNKIMKKTGFIEIKIKRIPADQAELSRYEGFLLVTAKKG